MKATDAAGWLLISSGILWIFLKTVLDFVKGQPQQTPEDGIGITSIVDKALAAAPGILKAPFGVGIIMILIGAFLLFFPRHPDITLKLGEPSATATPAPTAGATAPPAP
ncbi:MAG TPA: hypothetical protein VFA34_09220 [Actinomycetota bacterium]|jgi:hypothetical protein|nr:hypothetical protein [Actinomycetota bacterium]